MWNTWKKEIIRAIWMLVIVALVSLVINHVRTPVLNAAASRGWISPGTAVRMRGLNLIDSWKHEGKPGIAELPGEPRIDGTPVPDPVDRQIQIIPIEIVRTKEFYDSGEAVFFDARQPEYYAEEGHIPGALNWDANNYDLYRSDFIDTLERDQPIVAYCIGGACDESYYLAMMLINEGFTEVYLFEGGSEEWMLYGYPVNFGSEP